MHPSFNTYKEEYDLKMTKLREILKRRLPDAQKDIVNLNYVLTESNPLYNSLGELILPDETPWFRIFLASIMGIIKPGEAIVLSHFLSNSIKVSIENEVIDAVSLQSKKKSNVDAVLINTVKKGERERLANASTYVALAHDKPTRLQTQVLSDLFDNLLKLMGSQKEQPFVLLLQDKSTVYDIAALTELANQPIDKITPNEQIKCFKSILRAYSMPLSEGWLNKILEYINDNKKEKIRDQLQAITEIQQGILLIWKKLFIALNSVAKKQGNFQAFEDSKKIINSILFCDNEKALPLVVAFINNAQEYFEQKTVITERRKIPSKPAPTPGKYVRSDSLPAVPLPNNIINNNNNNPNYSADLNKILEAITGLNKRMDTLETKFDIRKSLDTISSRVETIETKIDELKTEINKRSTPVTPTSAVQQQLKGLFNKK